MPSFVKVVSDVEYRKVPPPPPPPPSSSSSSSSASSSSSSGGTKRKRAAGASSTAGADGWEDEEDALENSITVRILDYANDHDDDMDDGVSPPPVTSKRDADVVGTNDGGLDEERATMRSSDVVSDRDERDRDEECAARGEEGGGGGGLGWRSDETRGGDSDDRGVLQGEGMDEERSVQRPIERDEEGGGVEKKNGTTNGAASSAGGKTNEIATNARVDDDSDDSINWKIDLGDEDSIEPMLACDRCDTVYRKEKSWKKHIFKRHPKIARVMAKNGRLFAKIRDCSIARAEALLAGTSDVNYDDSDDDDIHRTIVGPEVDEEGDVGSDMDGENHRGAIVSSGTRTMLAIASAVDQAGMGEATHEFACLVCDRSFEEWRQCLKHYNECHPGIAIDRDRSIARAKLLKFACVKCDQVFKRWELFVKHCNGCHPGLIMGRTRSMAHARVLAKASIALTERTQRPHEPNGNSRRRDEGTKKHKSWVSDNVLEGKSAGAVGPGGDFVEFPDYNVHEEPHESKKAFTLFCKGTRKEVKNSLSLLERKDKNHVNGMLKDRWDALSGDGKQIWKEWEIWDAKRYEYQLGIYQKKNSNQGSTKKAKSVEEIPKTTSNNTAEDGGGEGQHMEHPIEHGDEGGDGERNIRTNSVSATRCSKPANSTIDNPPTSAPAVTALRGNLPIVPSKRADSTIGLEAGTAHNPCTSSCADGDRDHGDRINQIPAFERFSEYRIDNAASVAELESIRRRLLNLVNRVDVRLKEKRFSEALSGTFGKETIKELSIHELMDMLSQKVDESDQTGNCDFHSSVNREGNIRKALEGAHAIDGAGERQRLPITCSLCFDQITSPISVATCEICDDDRICNKCHTKCSSCHRATCADCLMSCDGCGSDNNCSDCVAARGGKCVDCYPKAKNKKNFLPQHASNYHGSTMKSGHTKNTTSSLNRGNQMIRLPQFHPQTRRPLCLNPPHGQSFLRPNAHPANATASETSNQSFPRTNINLGMAVTNEPPHSSNEPSQLYSIHRFIITEEGTIGINLTKLSRKCLVSTVHPRSIAFVHGIEEGDEILYPGHESEVNRPDVYNLFIAATKHRPLLFEVKRSYKRRDNKQDWLPGYSLHRFNIDRPGKIDVFLDSRTSVVRLDSVAPSGLGALYGLRKGDILCQTFRNGKLARNTKDLTQSVKSGRPYVIEVWRALLTEPSDLMVSTRMPEPGSGIDQNPFIFSFPTDKRAIGERKSSNDPSMVTRGQIENINVANENNIQATETSADATKGTVAKEIISIDDDSISN